jgi:hypothetical protein
MNMNRELENKIAQDHRQVPTAVVRAIINDLSEEEADEILKRESSQRALKGKAC